MAKFLNTSGTNYYLEELIKNASDRLILISPFLKLNDRVKELLEDKNRLKIDVRVVYGKNDLHPEEINWLKELTFVRTSFCRNLHAKCYLSEKSCIITSLNLYEFSQVNNNEMGVALNRTEDPDLYREAYDEALRIIRISDEVRMSLEKVSTESSIKEPCQGEESGSANDKLSTSKLARKLGLGTQDFLDKLASLGYLHRKDEEYYLTETGKDAGGEFKFSKRFGPYFVWPASLSVV